MVSRHATLELSTLVSSVAVHSEACRRLTEKQLRSIGAFTLPSLPVISAKISGLSVAFTVPTWGGVSKQHTNSTHLGPYTFLRHGASVNTSRGETGHRVWYGDVSQLPPPTVGAFKTAEQNYKNTNKEFRGKLLTVFRNMLFIWPKSYITHPT